MRKIIKQQTEPGNAEDLELKSSLNFTKTFTDKLAVVIINSFGSIVFLLSFIFLVIVWICWNTNIISGLKPFDPFPFSSLEMSVSIFAIILSISVLINQNRQGRIEKIKQQVEFEVNVRAESEVTKILNMLHDIHQQMGLNSQEDKELEKMKEQTDLKEIHKSLHDRQTDGNSLM